MKRETVESKLNALFGLTEKAEVVKIQSTGKVVGVTEEEIQEFREAQGLVYFLRAPALFTPKICPHCGEHFMVSRKYVAYCSYTCIRNSLLEQGIQWRKGHDLEALASDPQVWDGNEPIWIKAKSLNSLKDTLKTLLAHLENEESPHALSDQPLSPLGGSLSLETTTTSKTAKKSTSRSATSAITSTQLPSDLFPGVQNSTGTTKSQSSRTTKKSKRKFT